MRLAITVLVENTVARPGLLGEHGLALWIEVAGHRILFDTGQSRLVLANARKLGINLGDADAIILSHGHYDHTGGLAAVLRISPHPRVFTHPAALSPKFSRHPAGDIRNIGMPRAGRRLLLHDAGVLRTNEWPVEVFPGFSLTGPPPRTADFEDTGGDFLADRQGQNPDLLPDDQAAFIDAPEGTVVILGCAHAGISNTLRQVRRLTGNRTIAMVIGGMHLNQADPERLDRTIAELRALNIPRLYPCHCTGFAATARLCQEFPGRVAPCPAGTVIDLTEPRS